LPAVPLAAVTLATVTLAAVALASGVSLAAAIPLAAVTLVVPLLAGLGAAGLAVPPAVTAALVTALAIAGLLALTSRRAAGALGCGRAVRPNLHGTCRGPVKTELAPLAAAVADAPAGLADLRGNARFVVLCVLATGGVPAPLARLC
jgi:hypothetical protein